MTLENWLAIVGMIMAAAVPVCGAILLMYGRVVRLETQMDLFLRTVSLDAAKILHQPHPDFARRDLLLERFTDNELTEEDESELLDAMAAVINNNGETPGLRQSASIIKAEIERRRIMRKRSPPARSQPDNQQSAR